MKAVLHRLAPFVPVIDLLADAPPGDPRAGAYLLAAYAGGFAPGTVFLCVVDPGVGGTRAPVVAEADQRWFVGPDNGLFALVARRAGVARAWEIAWRPASLSASFHGRDLFAPVGARLALGAAPPGPERPAARLDRPDWPDELAAVVYIDRYGNAMTGLRATSLPATARLCVAGRAIGPARTFSDVPPGTAFWYGNADGLAEIAVNLGRADRTLGIGLGTPVTVATGPESVMEASSNCNPDVAPPL
jgi:S-adenosyl-L-methionine hydrolase (adenosine-forming)